MRIAAAPARRGEVMARPPGSVTFAAPAAAIFHAARSGTGDGSRLRHVSRMTEGRANTACVARSRMTLTAFARPTRATHWFAAGG